MNKEKFIFQYVNEYGPLTDKAKSGLLFLLTKLENDNTIADVRHVAYMLATVKHECGNEWQAIKEYSRGKGSKYGKPAGPYNQIYYGRGYVQLTWLDNYKAMSAVVAKDLVQFPDLMLEGNNAYTVMSFGMRKGSFTGVGLSKYINAKKCDYRNARRIINGLDCADKIAGYATKIEIMLINSVLDNEFKQAA